MSTTSSTVVGFEIDNADGKLTHRPEPSRDVRVHVRNIGCSTLEQRRGGAFEADSTLLEWE